MAKIVRARSRHLSKRTANKTGQTELNKKNARFSGYYTRKDGKYYVNFYYYK